LIGQVHVCNDDVDKQYWGAMAVKEAGQDRAAFLLSQIVSRSAQQFGQLLVPLGLTPADAGILRLIGRSEGLSQQSLSQALNMHANSME
jgi:hypothetical protein